MIRRFLLPACMSLGLCSVAFAQNAPQPGLNPPPAPPPQSWMPRGTADIQALNKVDAHVTQLVVPVGQSVHFGSLTITLQACMTRPPDEAPDSTAFLVVQDSHEGAPGFTGWILAQEPEVNMLEHPLYGLRLSSCH